MEKYPTKRAYATGKLYKFLKEKGVYKQYALNCKKQKRKKGQKDKFDFIGSFRWCKTNEGFEFWSKLFEEFSSEQT